MPNFNHQSLSHLVENYLDILNENEAPNESYKYLAIDTFQQNWNIEAPDFHLMLKKALSKVDNLLYQNSRGFIEKSAQLFPEETRTMFQKLFDESIVIAQRIKTFQNDAEAILSKMKIALNQTNIKTQQDERTISVYLAFRFPEKYILYKADYYKSFCKKINVTSRKTGERFLHLQELAEEIIQDDFFKTEDFISSYRKYYPKPIWEDRYLMIQNMLYVTNYVSNKPFDLIGFLSVFDKKQLQDYYKIIDRIIKHFGLIQGDTRLVFNKRKDKFLILTIGQRYVARLSSARSSYKSFGVISSSIFSEHFENFETTPPAYWNETNDYSNILSNELQILKAIEEELNKSSISGFLKHNRKDLEKMAFDIDFRNEILNHLSYISNDKTTMEANEKNSVKTPLNQILYGAPGTGKTYTLRNKYFAKYTVSEKNISLEANFEEMVRGLTWWQVIALALLEMGTSNVNDILENRWVSQKAILSESKNVRATIWGTLQFHTIAESDTVNYTQRQAPYIFYKTIEKKWTLIESELKEQAPEIYDILDAVNNFKPNPNKEIKHYVFTTFHQSFSYEDFIEGIKSVMEEGKETISYQIEMEYLKNSALELKMTLIILMPFS